MAATAAAAAIVYIRVAAAPFVRPLVTRWRRLGVVGAADGGASDTVMYIYFCYNNQVFGSLTKVL